MIYIHSIGSNEVSEELKFDLKQFMDNSVDHICYFKMHEVEKETNQFLLFIQFLKDNRCKII